MRRACFTVVLALLCVLSAQAEEYFVSKQGSDAATGRSEAKAFATIGKGIKALKPGDTLTILPGEYFESVRAAISGKPGKPITIRAREPGTVLMRGDVDVADFEPAPGLRYTWVRGFDGKVEGVGERDTAALYAFVPSPAEVQDVRRSCFHDAKAKKLYVHTSDSAPPDRHRMIASVTNGFGILIVKLRAEKTAHDIVIDGLAFSGYMNRDMAPRPGGLTRWGLYIVEAERCRISRCTAFLNGGGIGLVRPMDCIVEHCLAFGNFSTFCASGGNIISWTPARNTVMRHNVTHTSNANGLRFYGGGSENCRLERNLSYGCKMGDIWIKGGKNKTSRMVGNVSLGALHNAGRVDPANIRNNILLHGAGTDKIDKSNIILGKMRRLNREANFADPAHHDFRLQSGSVLRGKGPGGADPGPFPYRDEVYFVGPKGKDSGAGTSVKLAWRSLKHATDAAKGGDTVYVLPGVADSEVEAARAALTAKGVVLRLRGRPEAGRYAPVLHKVQSTLRIEDVRVHCVSATTANIEWWTPTAEATTQLEWGLTRACKNKVENIHDGAVFHTVSLIGLKPDTAYFYRVSATAPAWEFHTHPGLAQQEKTKARDSGRGGVLGFRTLARDPEPRTLHVATHGDDARHGLSLAGAWRTLRHAAAAARPGDTVLIHAGTYEEHVPVRVTGDAGRPVTFRCAPGEQVWMDGSGQKRATSFRLAFKHHVWVDGLYFRNFRMKAYQGSSNTGSIRVVAGSHNGLRRCFYDGRAKTYMPYFILAADTRGFTMENCVVIKGWNCVSFWRSPDLVIRNCAFYNGLIRNLNLFNAAEQKVTLTHNLICDNIPQKRGNALTNLWHLESYRGDHNLYFCRRGAYERWFLSYVRVRGKKEPAKIKLADVQKLLGQDRHTQFANPGIRVVKEMRKEYKNRAEETRVEMHREGDKMAPLDFPDFFVDPQRPFAKGADGKPVGLDPAAFTNGKP